MRTKLGVDKVSIQFGRLTVAGNQTTTVVANPEIDSSVDVSVIMTPHENVSITPIEQTSDTFLVTTSDTAAATADFLITSTS